MLRLSVISLLAGGLQAAMLAPRPAMRPRQDTSSYSVGTIGYTSALTTSGGSTVWAPYTYYADYYYTSSVDEYFGWCTSTYAYDYSASTTGSSYTICNVYTTCDNGVLLGESSASYQCAGEGYKCATLELYASWEATEADGTELNCYPTSYNDTSTIYAASPPAEAAAPKTASATATAITTPTTTPATPAPTSTAPPATSTPASSGGGGSSNTGVIAGSVVGGVAVLAIAGVAIFWIMRRSRNHQSHPDPQNQSVYAPSTGVPSYYQPHPDKLADNMTMMPQYGQQQYDPHGSVVYPHNGTSPQGVGSTSPHPPQSPVPLYPEGFRGEMDGTGVPTVRTPPPQPSQPPHTGY